LIVTYINQEICDLDENFDCEVVVECDEGDTAVGGGLERPGERSLILADKPDALGNAWFGKAQRTKENVIGGRIQVYVVCIDKSP
jgi:hypothetical protein